MYKLAHECSNWLASRILLTNLHNIAVEAARSKPSIDIIRELANRNTITYLSDQNPLARVVVTEVTLKFPYVGRTF
jgi:hypothetical protein